MTKNKTKYGDVIGQLFEFAKENRPCSYTELNKFYQMKIRGKSSYDPVADRGGSFAHHMKSMRVPAKRHYSGNIEFLWKDTEKGRAGKYWFKRSWVGKS